MLNRGNPRYNSIYMNLNKIGSIRGKKVLFLQGPMGAFFAQLERRFLAAGAETFRIGFNVGDYFFSAKHAYTPYRGTPDAWPEFITLFLQEHKIDMIFLFGDCRYYQSTAIYAAKSSGIEVFVFEEGYIRPDYITMERYGVNDYSLLPRDPKFYRNLEFKELPPPQETNASAIKMGYSAIIYYILGDFFSWRYPHYIHHRSLDAKKELYLLLRNAVRKYWYKLQERGIEEKVKGAWSKKYFFVPLQTHNDFQILQHSMYRSVETFIKDVLHSFGEHASENYMLVFKHHPVDRGRKNYTDFIMAEAKLIGIDTRVKVLHDVHLPTLLKHARGTVTINSTVGLSSLYHKTPTLTMGNAIYDVEGLTLPASALDTFWSEQPPVDSELYQKFRQYLIENTQINGSFYGKLFLDEAEYS